MLKQDACSSDWFWVSRATGLISVLRIAGLVGVPAASSLAANQGRFLKTQCRSQDTLCKCECCSRHCNSVVDLPWSRGEIIRTSAEAVTLRYERHAGVLVHSRSLPTRASLTTVISVKYDLRTARALAGPQPTPVRPGAARSDATSSVSKMLTCE